MPELASEIRNIDIAVRSSLYRFTAPISIQFEWILSSFSWTLIDINRLMDKKKLTEDWTT